jgi:phosphoserine aminotransferase
MRIFNFSAGPAVLPAEVLAQARDEMLDWHGSGMSVMEMSHRGKEFISIAESAERDFRALLAIPPGYRVLFQQGGATAQFAMVPINLLRGKKKVDYIHTGEWAKKAIGEATKFAAVNIAASSGDRNFTYIPKQSTWKLDPDAAYVHCTGNETIGGIEFQWIPQTGDVPLVCDFSSSLLSRPLDVGRFALIYAGAQKNMGPAGVTVVIIRDDLLARSAPSLPSMLSYAVHAENGSMYNTPPVFAIYLLGLVVRWLLNGGGLEAIAVANERKASKLYAEIDRTGFYRGTAQKDSRSLMNITFRLPSEELEKQFVKEAEKDGMDGLKGHRSVGGIRASIYNAFPEEGVDALTSFMREFERRNG